MYTNKGISQAKQQRKMALILQTANVSKINVKLV